MNISSLFFCLSFIFLPYTFSYASGFDLARGGFPSEESAATSCRSTPCSSPTSGTDLHEGDSDATPLSVLAVGMGDSSVDSSRLMELLNISRSDEDAVTMGSSPSRVLDTSYVETDNEDEGADTIVSPLNIDKKDTILAADDTPIHLTRLCQLLKGYTIIKAKDGNDVVEKAKKEALKKVQIKVAFIDFQMPGQNGGEAALEIRNIRVGDEHPYKNTIFVCVSATPDLAQEYLIQDIANCFREDSTRGPKEVFHHIRRKIDTKADAHNIIIAVNSLLDKLASLQWGLREEAAVSVK